ncbi:Transcriptional regulator [Seminavis robusta]|uniref:Transcriptional regulator n=1 Tax=Seminavis robusta TaxID=568900 RepID=A0A9N8HF06_9STRA|nr:Transcriptional regulator [Seminavis robusta]|eukprot:Sro542_g163410.1 Transcriptional regulator (1067) ;mRNA; r:52247-55549
MAASTEFSTTSSHGLDRTSFPLLGFPEAADKTRTPGNKTRIDTHQKLALDSLGHLYGRETQVALLSGAFHSFLEPTPTKDVVTVRGESGTGKSVLSKKVEEFLQQNDNDNRGLCVTGKFDDVPRDAAEPYSAIAKACEMLCQTLLIRMRDDANDYGDLPHRMRESLNNDDIDLLLALMPSLQTIVGGGGDGFSNGSINFLEVKSRFQHAFKQFIRFVCSVAPIVLILEDLQWVDQGSLDILECLLKNDDQGAQSSILLLMNYRDDEVDADHRFAKFLGILKEQQAADSQLQMTDIRLEGLSEEDVEDLLKRLLEGREDEGNMKLLAECVHSKTAGNPFYLKQFLASLETDGLLMFNSESDSWVFDVSHIQKATQATDNVLTLLTKKLRKLSPLIQAVLPRLACLGPRFATTTAHLVLDHVTQECDEHSNCNESIIDVLLTCQQEGLIVDCGGNTTWEWSHDKVKETAFLLVENKDKLDHIKYGLGQALLERVPKQSLKAIQSILCNCQFVELQSTSAVAKLNLNAGKSSMRSSASHGAAQYLKHGIALLPAEQGRWAPTYLDLSLALYATAAEAQYCIGCHEQVKELCDEVLAQPSLPLLKKRRLYNVQIHSLASQAKMAEATDLVLKVLSKIGYKPPKLGRGLLSMSGIVSMSMTVDKTIGKLERLKPMEDEEKKWGIYLLDRLASYSYQCDASLFPPAITKALDWTVKHGRAETTSPLLATIALILAGSFSDFAGAKKYADLAIKYMTPSVKAQTYFMCYQFVYHYQTPNHVCIRRLNEALETGIKSGNLESAFYAGYCALEAQFHTGRNLQLLLEDCKAYAHRTDSYGQEMIGWSLSPVWQLAENLSRIESNGAILTGSTMDEEEFKQRTEPYAHFGVLLNRIKTTAAFWFDDHERVVQLMEECGYHKFSIEKATPATNGIGVVYFHCALSCLSLVHQAQKKHRPHKQQAKKILKKLKEWVNKGNPNVQHYESLLEAELASCSSRQPLIVASKHYDCAIMLAGRLGLANDYGLAQERFGDHFLRHGDQDGARHHYSLALESYEKWGATSRLNLLQARTELARG